MMLKFDPDLFMRIVGHVGLAQRERIEQIVDDICANGYKNIFLIGAGGTIALMYPYEYMLKSYSTLEVHAEIAAELIASGCKRLTKESVCIFASVSGTTPETLAAVQFCKTKGATTIGLAAEPGTPFARAVDYCVTTGDQKHSFDAFFLFLYMFTFRFMHNNNEFVPYDQFTKEVESLPKALVEAVEVFDSRAEQFAIRHKDTDFHMLIGSGSLWGNTYSFAMCILEEMQWIRTKSVHAAEFFHGTLELLEPGMSVMLMKGEDESRPLADRVQKFAEKITNELTVIDTKDFVLNGIHETFRKYFAVSVHWAVVSRISVYLERERNHSLDMRRYYRVMDY
ncbi:SIS domain-containing protein [Paenibacillus sp. P25]|nr:SIS domain-containing protein [Paenibacillus sp. P25]